MKRKVNRVGTGTLTVSLPSNWIKQNSIKQGDELEIKETASSLIINAKNENILKRINIDVRGLSSSLLLRKIYVAYVLGYEEIDLLVNDNEIEHTATKYLSLVENIPKKITAHDVMQFINLTGTEIIEQDKNRYLLSIMVSSNDTEFEKTLKRLFNLTKTYGEEVLEFVEKGFKGQPNSLNVKELTINKFYRLCTRIINTSVHGPKKTCLYGIVSKIEEMGDVYWNIIKRSQPKKVNKESLIRFREFTNIFSQFYLEFFKNSEENLSKIYSTIKKLEKDIQENSGEMSFLHAALLNLCDLLKKTLEYKYESLMIKE